MIEWMIERLKKCDISPIVVMTSTNAQDDLLVDIAKKNKIKHFRGSEEDVLIRMRDCARKFGPDLIISVTADDPLKEPIFINKMADKYKREGFDFCEIEGLPNGCEAYAVSRNALEKICEIKKDSDTEIWGNYFRKSGKFKCEVIKVDDPTIFRPHYRVTVDTPEDFELVSKIFEILLTGEESRSEGLFFPSSRKTGFVKQYFNIYDICKLLDERPDLVAINSHIEQKEAPKITLKNESAKGGRR